MLQRGCLHREIANTLHVSVVSIHNLFQVHVSDVECLRGGRPQKLNEALEQRCVLEMVSGSKRALQRASLCSQTKMKKPHLSSINVKACLEITRVYKD
jgi:hypothetical protein